jgi:hypothetical protein
MNDTFQIVIMIEVGVIALDSLLSILRGGPWRRP